MIKSKPKVDAASSHWTLVILPPTFLPNFSLAEIWRYRDLILLWVRRDLTTIYAQTFIGPLWYILQPLLTVSAYVIVFSKIARLPTDNVPTVPFYLSGLILWNFFNECTISISNTFQGNVNIFSKVYFPRLTIPIAQIMTTSVKFAIQFILFIAVFFYFCYPVKLGNATPKIGYLIFVLSHSVILSFSVGLLIASLTIKYRDLNFALNFFLQLWMYASPVIYPISQVPENYLALYKLNPMAVTISAFRDVFFNSGSVHFTDMLLSSFIVLIIFGLGLFFFHKVEKTFLDSI